jgi:outer membrane protein
MMAATSRAMQLYSTLLSILIATVADGVLAAAATPAPADADCAAPSDDCAAVGGWNFSVSLGAGVRTNPLDGGKDIPLVVIPQWSYYGKRLFIDDLDLGFTLHETDSNSFALIASPGYDRVFFYRYDPQNFLISSISTAVGPGGAHRPGQPPTKPAASELPANHPRVTYLAGPEWTFKAAGLSGQLDVLHDATGANSGTEIRGAIAAPLGGAAGALKLNLGFTWKSAAVVDYYYGVPGNYTPGSAFNPFVKLGFGHPLAGRWKFTAFYEYEHLGAAIADSPRVSNHEVQSVFMGVNYAF